MVSCRPPTAEVRVRSPVSPCGVCGGQNVTGTGFPPNTSVFPPQFHSTGAPLIGKIKKTNHLSLNLLHRVAQQALRLRCVRSFYCGALLYKKEQIEVGECLLSFGADLLSSSLLPKKYKAYDIQNYNFACCFVWV